MLLLSRDDLLLGDDANDHDDVVEEGTKKAQVEEVGKDRDRKSRALAENLMAGGADGYVVVQAQGRPSTSIQRIVSLPASHEQKKKNSYVPRIQRRGCFRG